MKFWAAFIRIYSKHIQPNATKQRSKVVRNASHVYGKFVTFGSQAASISMRCALSIVYFTARGVDIFHYGLSSRENEVKHLEVYRVTILLSV